MTIFDWLASADGQDVTHAVILLLAAITAFLSFRSHRHISEIDKHVKRKDPED